LEQRAAEVVVIGGGVMGTSIALHLARRGAGRILLCEKNTVASGPTGRSSGVLRRHYSLELYARMAHRSLEVYRRFEELTGVAAGLRTTGVLHLVGPEEHAALQTTVAMLQRIGAPLQALSLGEVARLCPRLDPEGLAGAVYDPHGGCADPAAVTHGYAARARQLGVTIHQSTRVIGVDVRGGRVAGVRTDRGAIDAPVVVNAAGVWAPEIARLAGVELPITVSRVQLAAFKLPLAFGPGLPVIGDNPQRCYFAPEVGDLVMVGTRNLPGTLPVVDPDRLDERIDPERAVAASEALCRRFPAMAEGRAMGGYASMYDVTPDAHFVLEESPAVAGFFIAAGFNGHGFKHSPVIGELVSELILDGKTSEFDVAPFSSLRFTDGRPRWRGLYRTVAY
jgi:glycine/D-amino acid oxidase-like deaminating enzyme